MSHRLSSLHGTAFSVSLCNGVYQVLFSLYCAFLFSTISIWSARFPPLYSRLLPYRRSSTPKHTLPPISSGWVYFSMHHLSPFLAHRKQTNAMDLKKIRRKPKLERRNAAKYFEYDAGSSSSSLDDSSGSLYTRSMEFYDRSSFRIEGVEGEFDLICRSLGLSGPEDFAIPAAAWEALKVRSSSDLLPRLKLTELEIQEKEELGEKEANQIVSELDDKCEERVTIRDISESGKDEPAETSGCCSAGDGLCGTGVGGGIKGIRPPMIKPPPGMRRPVIDNTCSTWDILRDFAPQGERQLLENNGELNYSDDDQEMRREPEKAEIQKEEEAAEGREVDKVNAKGDEEHKVTTLSEIVAELSGSCSFTTSNEDDSSSTTTEPRSTNISPNGKFRRIIATNWQKGDLLGRGSFGSVYEGISEDGFFFAVKEVSLLDQGSQGKQSVFQLEQEIALLSQFEHENIVQYYGTERDESKLYIFLELVTKGSLASLYRRYNLRDSQVSAYTRQILHGLKYLHDRKVIHRDIKCANILVDASGSVKLADFGLAKVVKGKNQGYGLPADIWSLGCTVLEMLTGQIPYSHLECMQALFRIGKGEQPPVPDSLSKDARDFILQCVQVNPDGRPTAANLLNHPFVQRPVSMSSGSASPYIPLCTSLDVDNYLQCSAQSPTGVGLGSTVARVVTFRVCFLETKSILSTALDVQYQHHSRCKMLPRPSHI
ncbi:mitogen-activated protein kinase kinase kinase 1-like [Senna tora]|uniref:mitogen-activated protein kinase kinase kinase n=1 Tax=Senna tora TaxID=362788 RepID=A0A834WH66_9FABA|nr:mitogen-activated protein kinase kinase kinase 1-like [Senna tora]